jgi:hypothetical protein
MIWVMLVCIDTSFLGFKASTDCSTVPNKTVSEFGLFSTACLRARLSRACVESGKGEAVAGLETLCYWNAVSRLQIGAPLRSWLEDLTAKDFEFSNARAQKAATLQASLVTRNDPLDNAPMGR